MSIVTLLLALAFVLLFLAALEVPARRVQLGWLGLAIYVLAALIGAWR
jgi:hypothetical protein